MGRDVVKASREKMRVFLDGDTMKKIQEHAKKEKIQPDKLAAKILANYHKFRKDGFIPVRNDFLLELLEKYTSDEIEDIASKMASRRNKTTILNFQGIYDTKSFLKTVNDWLDSTNFPYSHEIKGSKHRFVILHGLGTKWSLYMAKLISGTLNNLGLVPEYDYTDKVLSLSVNLKEKKLEKRQTEKQIPVLSSAVPKQKHVP